MAAREIGLECYLFLRMKNNVVSGKYDLLLILHVIVIVGPSIPWGIYLLVS